MGKEFVKQVVYLLWSLFLKKLYIVIFTIRILILFLDLITKT